MQWSGEIGGTETVDLTAKWKGTRWHMNETGNW